MTSTEQQMTQIIDQLMYLEIKSDNFRKSAYNPDPQTLPPLEVLLEEQCTFHLADRLGPMPNWPLTTTLLRWDGKNSRKHWVSFDLLGALEYAKTFEFFHKIPRKDKMLLAKAVCLMCSNLTQAYFSYANKSEHLLRPDGTDFPEPADPTDKIGPAFFRTNVIGNRWASDKKETIVPLIRNGITRVEYVLVKAIMICNASVPDLSQEAMDILSAEKQKMSNVLCTYCLTHFGRSGPARYAANLALIAQLEHVTKQQKDFVFLMSIGFAPMMKIDLVEKLFS